MAPFHHSRGLIVFALGALAIAGASPANEAPKRKEEKRLAMKEAETLVRQHLGVNLAKPIPLIDLTSDGVWDKLKVQVFKIKYTTELPNSATFVLRQGKVIPIGRDFGGGGVNSVCAADLKGNGQPYLVFSYHWGSGIHRSQIGALDCLAKEPKEITATQSLVLDFAHDWSVRLIDAKTVRVEGGGVSFGNLALEEKDGKAILRINLPADLPAAIKKNVQ